MSKGKRTDQATPMHRSRWLLLGLLVGAVFCSGCAGLSGPEYGTYDDAEGFNRFNYRVTDWVDRNALVPVARGYNKITPEFWRTGVSNVFANLRNIDSSLNGLLQGKLGKSSIDLTRVVVNSTIGIAGIFDVATKVGLVHGEEDLGQTFAVWGKTRSNYLFVPVAGPSALRDAPGALIKAWMPRILLGSHYSIWLGLLDGLNARAEALVLTDARDSSALDPYVFTRDAYFQRRKFLVYDGDPPMDDFFDDESFDDEVDELDAEDDD
ncbi:MAG: MlaA family lipoprotein [Pseudomonadales bacterium]